MDYCKGNPYFTVRDRIFSTDTHRYQPIPRLTWPVVGFICTGHAFRPCRNFIVRVVKYIRTTERFEWQCHVSSSTLLLMEASAHVTARLPRAAAGLCRQQSAAACWIVPYLQSTVATTIRYRTSTCEIKTYPFPYCSATPDFPCG